MLERYQGSQNEGKLIFNEQPPGDVAYIEMPFDGYELEGRILYNTAHQDPWVLSIHGARADFTKSNAVSFGLQERGYSLLGLNMSGHSQAGVLDPGQTTLANNIAEAEAFFAELDPSRPKVVFGFSLGGTPALELLKKHGNDIDKLVLFYPGVYTKDSYDKHFGDEFRAVISQPFSYRNNDTIEQLRSFKGDLLLVVGEYDGLDPESYGKPAGTSVGEVDVDGKKYYSPIPKEVIDMVYGAIPEERRQRITIPDCDHSVILWMREHPTEADRLLDQIDTFLKT